MATYAIGDIQGCHDDLQVLLEKLCFDPARDTLWFTGDLVNRGPKSLESLRFVKDLGDRAVTVLGNHDLHLLALWAGRQKDFKPTDTLRPILEAPDRDALLDWLRHRPLVHHDESLGFTLVHAGLPPQWDLETALACAAEVERTLQGADFPEFMNRMYGNEPRLWAEDLSGWDRLRFSVNCFTRLRYCTPEGELEFKQKGAPGTAKEPLVPWFQVKGRKSAGLRVVFGHWSTLGLHMRDGVYALDTGCLWGGTMTALRLDDPALPVVSVDCPGAQSPGLD